MFAICSIASANCFRAAIFGIFWRNANYNSNMNIVWTVITVASLAVMTAVNPQSVLSVCVDSGSQALKTALELCGVYCLWLGIFRVAEECRLVEKLAKRLQPLNKVLYGNLPDQASQYVSLNFASNLLGVGNAATPSAVEALKLTENVEKLSFAGTMLFVMNASGVQLVPTTVIGLRAAFGSTNAADVVFPNFICTLFTSVLGVVLVFLLCRSPNKKACQTTRMRQLVATRKGAKK